MFKYKYFNTEKWLTLLQDIVTNFSPEYMSCKGSGIRQSHDNKI